MHALTHTEASTVSCIEACMRIFVGANSPNYAPIYSPSFRCIYPTVEDKTLSKVQLQPRQPIGDKNN